MDKTVVLTAEQRIGRIGLCSNSGNTDALTTIVAAAKNCKRTVKLSIVIKYTVCIEVGVNCKVCRLQRNIFDQCILLHIHIRHCHICCDTDTGDADNGSVDTGFGSCSTICCDIDITADVDLAAGTGAGIAQDTGCCLCQILCNRNVHVHICSRELHTANGGCNNCLCIADISIGNIQLGTADVHINTVYFTPGLYQCFEGSLCISVSCMQANRYNAKTNGCNIGNRCGFRIIGNIDISCA